MLIEVKVPELQKKTGEITEGMSCPIDPKLRELQNLIKLVKWYVKDTDFVSQEAALCILETSKASVEIPAEKNGFVKLIKEEGAIVSIHETLCLLADSLEETQEKADSPEDIQEPPSFWLKIWKKCKRIVWKKS